MSETECLSCRKRAGAYNCVVCEDPVCKPCSETVGDPFFITVEKIPENLASGRFCGRCFDDEMAPQVEAYKSTLEAAKQVFIFFKTQRKQIPLIRKAKTKVEVPECADRDETILRLAYFAAKEDYNAVIEVDVVGKKVREAGSAKTAVWSGSGYPASVDGAKIDRNDLQEQIHR